MDCFASLAMTASCSTHDLSIPRRDAPESCVMVPPSKIRGRREDRVRAAPAVSCAKCTKENAHEHTGSAEALRHSLRNGFTAYIALLCPQNLPECANGRFSPTARRWI